MAEQDLVAAGDLNGRLMNRQRLLSVLTALAALLVLGATVMVFAQDRVFDRDDFATTLGSTLRDPAVNKYLAEEVSQELIAQAPNLAISGPLLADVTGSVLESDAAVGVVEFSAREAHQVVFEGGGDALVLELSDLVVSVQQALQAISPELAESIPDEVESLTVALSAGELTAGTVRLAEQMRLLTYVLVALASATLMALVVLERSIFGGLARLGFVLGFVGLALIVVVAVGAVVLGSYGRGALERDALLAAWDIVLGDLVRWGWVLVVVGAMLASLGWAVANAGNVIGRAIELTKQVLEPESRRVEALRNVLLVVGALWALVSPSSLVAAMVRVAGFGLAVFLLARLLDRSGLAERLSRVSTDVRTDDAAPGLGAVGARLGWTALVLVGLGFIATILLGADDDASALADPNACNGDVELCDRRLDEVTMAAAHNSMSSTATGFYLPNHLSSMRAMLDQGVRGFMIDTVYGRAATDGSVRTSLGLVDVESLDEGARRAAEAVQARQTGDLGPEMVYLCHGFCEIGALDAVSELTELREWLEDNPREVVVIIVQDATEPGDTAQVFTDAGFADLVYTHDRASPLPTLGDMIRSGRRVLIMVEEDGDGVDWLHPAFALSQETPFSFSSAEEFSCAANRGEPDSPLFVVNHFITLAVPSNQSINDFDPLLARAEQCQTERGMRANLLALDFIGQGDVMAVVDRLNGVG